MIRLVTGGSRSGKSSFAESLYREKDDVVYIATSKILDKEMEERIDLHRNTRPGEWRTYEGNYDLKGCLGQEEYYLLDSVTVMVSNIMFDITKDLEYIDYKAQAEVENKIVSELEVFIDKIKNNTYNLILVTDEVGSSIVPEHHISRVFRDIQGRVNQRLASIADEVYLVCCGLPVKIK